jgi:N-acetylneuraminic acid mutarotase
VIGGKLFVAGGNNAAQAATRRLDVYDPATNTWSTKTALPSARVATGAAVVGGKLYVVGGRNGTSYLDAVVAYDAVTDSWTKRAPMITPRAALGAGAVGGRIYAIGGRNSSDVYVVNERYTP